MKLKINLLLCFLLLFFIGKTNAQTVPAEMATRFDHILDSMRTKLSINGLGAAVQLSNNAIWAGGSGVSTFSPSVSIDESHVFATGSSTKTITGACILQLVDEGVLSLDDSLHQWLPNLLFVDKDITIRQLLQHQSGIFDVLQHPNFQAQMLADRERIWTIEQVVRQFLRLPVFRAGTSWGYSNTNYLLLGMIIEEVTGKPFHQELKDRFFTPMGLDSYANFAYDNVPDNVAHLWLDLDGDGQQDDAHDFFTGWKSMFSATDAAGGWFASPTDLARWMRSAMTGDLYSADTWAEALTTVTTNFSGGTRYGLGLMERKYCGLTGLGHGGDISYSTQAFYFPEKDISITVIGNDSRIISWNLTTTVNALLKAFLAHESTVNTDDAPSVDIPIFSVSPNPFSSNLNLHVNFEEGGGNYNLNLFSLNGQNVWSKQISEVASGRQSFLIEPAADLATGMYFLRVSDGERSVFRKVVKE